MYDLNLPVVLVSAVVAFVISGGYYGAFGGRLAQLSPAYAGPQPSAVATALVEVVRNLVLAAVVAGLSRGLGLDGLARRCCSRSSCGWRSR